MSSLNNKEKKKEITKLKKRNTKRKEETKIII